MSYFYPQSAIILKVVFESFDGSQTKTSSLENDPFKVYTFTVLARRVSVQVNEYTQADTFNCEIDFKQFPFDPRAIRNCGVSIAMDDLGRHLDEADNPLLIVPNEDNIVFQGFADEDSITFDEEKRTVRLEGRDFTALFLDQKWPGKTINKDIPIDQLIQSYILELEAVKNIQVVNLTGRPLLPLSKFAPDYELQGTKQNAHPNASYWDVIQDIVKQAALISYIAIDKLVITKPRVLYNESQAKRLIYGVNLKNLEFKRKLGRKKGFNIAIRSYDYAEKEPVVVEIPAQANEDWLKSIGLTAERITIPQINSDGSKGEPKDAPIISFFFDNMTEEQATEKGQSVFEEMGRQQIEGSLTTHDMLIPQVNGSCEKAIHFDVGTPVKVEIAQDDLAKITRLASEQDKIQYLINRCYTRPVATALARSLGKFSLTFYTKSIELDMDQDQGFSMKLNFINFIQIENKSL